MAGAGMILANEKAFGGKRASEIWAKARAARAGSLSMPARAPGGSGRPQATFHMAFEAFAASIKGTPDEVWTKVLRRSHSAAKMTHGGWTAALAAAKR